VKKAAEARETPQGKNILLSASPHIRSGESTRRIMWTVSATLMPAAIWAVYFFGIGSALVLAVSIISAVFTEAAVEKIFKAPLTVGDGSAFLTGVLVAFVLPPNCPLYVAAVASFTGIAVAKMAFGGLGSNIWNPALIGRAFVQFAYPQYVSLSEWPIGKSAASAAGAMKASAIGISGSGQAVHAVTQASPLSDTALGTTLSDSPMYGYFDLVTGTIPGSLGEVFKIWLIIGGIYLICRRYVNWRVPFFYILTVAVLVYVFPGKKISSQGFFSGDVIYHIFSGGLILGAFYMATDMVTTPITNKGLIVFGIGCGVLTAVIRLYGGFPEGVCYSILLMNTATPLIDKIIQPKVFGGGKKK